MPTESTTEVSRTPLEASPSPPLAAQSCTSTAASRANLAMTHHFGPAPGRRDEKGAKDARSRPLFRPLLDHYT